MGNKQSSITVFILGALFGVFVFVLAFSLGQVEFGKKFVSVFSRSRPISTPNNSVSFEMLSSHVIPQEGFTVNINWGDIGKKLVEQGAIDIEKYKKNYPIKKNYPVEQYKDILDYLTETQNKGITINSLNSYFWVNTLWALGLTQQSDILEKGIMGTEYKKELGNFASIAGWTLGVKDAASLYSSAEIISLTQKQQEQVKKISGTVYRSCCSNPTSFPDCNHGMATLGLIEIMVSQDFAEKEIYEAILAFNSYWFPQTYVDLAYYFQTKEKLAWKDVDPEKVLSAKFSSGQGYQAIKEQIGNIPGAPQSGASCGA